MTAATDRIVTRKAETLVAACGTQIQLERWQRGGLSIDELLEIARRTAFMTFEAFPRYKRLEPDDLKHSLDCESTILENAQAGAAEGLDAVAGELAAAQEISFSVFEEPTLSAPLGRAYRKIQLAGGRAALAWASRSLEDQFTEPVLRSRLHSVACPHCDASLARYSVLIEVSWLGRTLSREYALV